MEVKARHVTSCKSRKPCLRNHRANAGCHKKECDAKGHRGPLVPARLTVQAVA